MQLGKTSFIVLLTILFVLPFIIYKTVWIAGATRTNGTMCFMGRSLNGQFSSDYPIIKFSTTGKDTIFFNGKEGVELQRGEQVPVLYYKKNPENARVFTFAGIWVDTVMYAAIPLVILLIIFFHPDIIPARSTIILGKKPFIRLVE